MDSSNIGASYDDIKTHYSQLESAYSNEQIKSWGYDDAWMISLGLPPDIAHQASGGGCPLQLRSLALRGATVVDMGCGAGHDVAIAAAVVGEQGRVYGLDITPQQLQRSRATLQRCDGLLPRVHLLESSMDSPDGVPQQLVAEADLVLSNGAFNLCRDKQQAFHNAFRMCKPGAYLHLSDVCRIDRAVVVG